MLSALSDLGWNSKVLNGSEPAPPVVSGNYFRLIVIHIFRRLEGSRTIGTLVGFKIYSVPITWHYYWMSIAMGV